MKKFLLIALACALLLSASACKGKKDENKDAETTVKYVDGTNADGTPVTDENGNTVTETIVETVPGESDPATEATMPEGTVIEPNEPSEEDKETANQIGGGSIIVDDEGNEFFVEDDYPEQEKVDEGGTNATWPSVLPAEVPQFTNYISMDPTIYQDFGDYDFWSTGFYTTEENYDAYLNTLAENGFKKSDDIFAVWGKGNITIDLSTETTEDGFWTNFEISKIKDLSVPAEFFAFETDQAIYFAETDDGYICIDYECGTDFDADADAYLETLAANGFTVSGDTATKGNFVCTVDREDTLIIYEF